MKAGITDIKVQKKNDRNRQVVLLLPRFLKTRARKFKVSMRQFRETGSETEEKGKEGDVHFLE